LGVVDFDEPVRNAVRLMLWATGEGKLAFGETDQVSPLSGAAANPLNKKPRSAIASLGLHPFRERWTSSAERRTFHAQTRYTFTA